METKQHATKNQWANEEIKKGIRKYLETTKNTNFPKSIGFSKSSSRGKFIVTDASLKKKKKTEINNLTYYINELEKEE